MSRFFQYYGQYQNVRGGVGGLPSWAKLLLFLVAIPGMVLIGLSILALGVSILALLLLTVPTYRLVRAVTGTGRTSRRDGVFVEAPAPFETSASTETRVSTEPEVFVGDVVDEAPRQSTGRRTIDVKIVD